jgi:2-dehydropantoate 2-reductase
MRYIIFGAGAIGGAIGGRLARAGRDVTLVARGAHASALRDRGLTLRSPADTSTLKVPVMSSLAEVTFRGDEVVILAVKSQDTLTALQAIEEHAPSSIQLVCAQNGVANERAALRHFPNVIGMCVALPATHLEPGVVEVSSAGTTGILDVGRYPAGVDTIVNDLAAELSQSSFVSVARPEILRWKYRKLLMNLANAVSAICGSRDSDGDGVELIRLARLEGARVLAAAAIDVASEAEDTERRAQHLNLTGKPRGGSSSWQSLERGTGSIEADYLNGEIVLLGRLHGVSTPVNELLRKTANELARRRLPPGGISASELRSRLTASTA